MNKIFEWIRNNFLVKLSEFGLIIGVVLIIVMMIIPMPTILLDLFMVLNLLLSFVIILNILYIRSPLEFSSFPTLLLISTVFSLALNVSSTRLILSRGELFDGRIVRSFGTFVVGTQNIEGLVIGPIIFIIIMIVQFIVITKGSSRVAEVSARFTLDSMPGKQMAIEAEFNSGAISEDELMKKRVNLQREADFYGSMDGASKFISGNIIAGFIITFINIAGGLIVGVLIRGEPIQTAIVNYIQLTIGDGLVSQFPTLLISTASGIIVTKAVSAGNISDEIRKEFSNYTRLYYIVGAILGVMAFLPGFPWYILLPLALLLGYVAFASDRKKKKTAEKQDELVQKTKEAKPEAVVQAKLEPLEPLTLEIGYDLVPLVQDSNGQTELLNRISSIRREVGVKLGLVIPLMRIQDNYLLKPDEYTINFSGVEIARANIKINKFLAIQTPRVLASDEEEIQGEKTLDPAFLLPAYWIDSEHCVRAEKLGYTVADPTSVIATHIATIIETNAAELLSRQDVSDMLDNFKEKYPVIVTDVTKDLSIGQIQRVLQRLLLERISIRNLRAIFEKLSDFGSLTKDIDFLVEKARQSLARQISGQYSDASNTLHVFTLDPKIEQMLIDTRKEGASQEAMLSPNTRNQIINSIAHAFHGFREEQAKRQQGETSISPVLVSSEMARPIVYKLLGMSLNNKHYSIPIVSTLEISENTSLFSLGSIRIQEEELVESGDV